MKLNAKYLYCFKSRPTFEKILKTNIFVKVNFCLIEHFRYKKNPVEFTCLEMSCLTKIDPVFFLKFEENYSYDYCFKKINA